MGIFLARDLGTSPESLFGLRGLWLKGQGGATKGIHRTELPLDLAGTLEVTIIPEAENGAEA